MHYLIKNNLQLVLNENYELAKSNNTIVEDIFEKKFNKNFPHYFQEHKFNI